MKSDGYKSNDFKFLHLAAPHFVIDQIGQGLVIARFCPKNVAKPLGNQQLDMRAVRRKPVFSDDWFQVFVFFINSLEQPLGGIAFTIILGLSITFCDRFRCQGNHCGMIGMNNDSPQQLMVVFQASIAVFFDATLGAFDGVGAEMTRSIN